MLFQAVMKFLSRLVEFKILVNWGMVHFRLIIPSNIHLQCLCSTINEEKQHNEGNMALRIISILTH
jgi:hypothetical protein